MRVLALALALLPVLGAPQATPKPAPMPSGSATCGDCREGDFNEPRIYFYWTNTTASQCCDLCSANKTCAFAIHDGTVGNCFPSPAGSTGFKSQGGIRACRTASAPPWPAPGPPPPARFAVSTWPQLSSLHGNATGGSEHAAPSATIEVKCAAGGGCPNAEQLEWYEQRLQADAPDGLSTGSQHPTVAPSGGLVHTVSCSVAEDTHTVMLPDTNESYRIECRTGACDVSSATTIGALRGLETLAHLAHDHAIPIPLTLRDAPRFPYRGLLIDSARHFIPVRNIKRMIDGMSTMKLNVLRKQYQQCYRCLLVISRCFSERLLVHSDWHLTDIESFPVQSERYPALSGKGAFRPNLVYTRANLTEVVRYGGLRGVRIMPEFDVPGHAGWAMGRNFTSNREIYDRTFLSEIDCL